MLRTGCGYNKQTQYLFIYIAIPIYILSFNSLKLHETFTTSYICTCNIHMYTFIVYIHTCKYKHIFVYVCLHGYTHNTYMHA